MPRYDYRCEGCRKKFTLTLTLDEKERRKAACPKCGGKKLTQQFSGFFAKTTRKA